MQKTQIIDLHKYVGQTVELKGWVYSLRSSGKIKFLVLRDGSGFCQCVFFKGECDEVTFENLFPELTQETSVRVQGLVKKEPRSPGGYELSAQSLKIFHRAEGYPISPKEHGIDFLMNHRHLWLRSKRQHALLRIRAQMMQSMRAFFDSRNFTAIDAPIFTPSACEGTTDLFQTNYFDQQVFLSQSGQLYMEAAAAAFGKVYSVGPTFRAEKSKTRRHLIEFWMIEPEIAFADLFETMEIAEEFVTYLVKEALKKCESELKILERNTSLLENITPPFPRISYDEAVEMIREKKPNFEHGSDFGAPDETLLSEHFKKPVFIYHFPAAIKAFYMKEAEDKDSASLSFDLLATEGYGEIIGGGQREDRLEPLLKKIHEHNLPEKDFEWYLDLRRYGSFPHSGFGLGIERTLTWITGINHLRETIAFPRLYGRIYP